MPRPSSGGFSVDDYVDVAERIRQFYERFPDGRLVCGSPPQIVEIAGKPFVWYHAQAFRTPDDPRPGDGWAAEPVPGPTQFTRDSELMNAETAAWGRAIVACGFETKKIASAQEVRNRQPEPQSKQQRDRFAGLLAQLAAIDKDRDWVADPIGKWATDTFGKEIGDLDWGEYDRMLTKVEGLIAKAHEIADRAAFSAPTTAADADAAVEEMSDADRIGEEVFSAPS